MITNHGAPAARLDWRLIIGWSIGSLGASALINGITFLAQFYLTRTLGMAAGLTGALLFGAKLYDVVADPFMGILSDRTRTRHGRRRPYLLAGAVVSAVSFWMLFNPLFSAGPGLAVCAGIALLLYATGYTLFNIPYLAMPAEMTDDYHERSRLMSWRVVFVSFGLLAGGALGPALVAYFGHGTQAWSRMSVVLALIIGGSMAASFAGTRRAHFTTAADSPPSAREQWRTAAANRPFVILIASKFAHLIGVSVSTTSLLFLVTTVLGRTESAAATLGLASTAGVVISIPAWLWLSRVAGKRNAYLTAVMLYLPVTLSWLLASPSEPPAALAIRGLAIGLITGGLTLTAQAMLPDTIAHDYARSGLRREATFSAVYAIAEKLAFAAGPLVFGLVLQASGAPGGTERPDVIRYAAAWIPVVASGASALILLGYPLDRELRRTGRTGGTDP